MSLKNEIINLIHKIEFGKSVGENKINLKIYNKDLPNCKSCKKIFYSIRINKRISIIKVLSNINSIEYIFYNRDKIGDCKVSYAYLENLLKWEWAELIKLLKEIGDFETFEKYIIKKGLEFYKKWR